ncbi:hypothetical protein CW748_06895 [Alteromonadales bacterium alter-6D02]|nr:hypothetical protein CW748_06895 [Alteromonadales bacterium alter-6D02]
MMEIDSQRKQVLLTKRSLIQRLLLFVAVLACYMAMSQSISAKPSHYKIVIDADFTGSVTSSHSIRQGIETALAEVNHRIADYTFSVEIKDHRANSRRSKKNLESVINDPQALVVFSGLHSPPLLAHKDFINQSQVLLLDPWAAAGPITRSKSNENWIYRLSIDDRSAGGFIGKKAYQEGFRRPYLLLEDTGWGRSNEINMLNVLKTFNVEAKGVSWFNWGIGKNHAKLILRQIKQSGADVIFLVANAPEGKVFVQAMVELSHEFNLPIRSHWGITGGDFPDVIPHKQRKKIDLQFIQTRFSFVQRPHSELAASVLEVAISHLPEVRSSDDIKTVTGFVHAYDLTKILIAAIKQAGLSGDKEQDKLAVKLALENLNKPVDGLIKRYSKPFMRWSPLKPNAHEALREMDYAMGYFDHNNDVILIE